MSRRSAAACDVAIAGGGPAGAAAAISLATAGHRVLLAHQGHRDAEVGDALPPAARPLLRDLGAWDDLVSGGHRRSFGNLSAWGSSEISATDFIADPNGCGWQLDRRRFDRHLRDRAAAAGAGVFENTSLRRPVRQKDGGWRLDCLSPSSGVDTVVCDWIVDATGRRSSIARQLGGRRRADDALVGVSAMFNVRGEAGEDQDGRTLIEAAPNGWWYTGLLPDRRRVVAYLTDSDLARHDGMLDRGRFLASLESTQHVGRPLATRGYSIMSGPTVTAAHGARLEPAAGTRWLAVGDAALSFDPLSSQGILTALFTGVAAGQALHNHLSGVDGALDAYTQTIGAIGAAYRRNQRDFYRLERRWPDRPFWSRRCRLSELTADQGTVAAIAN